MQSVILYMSLYHVSQWNSMCPCNNCCSNFLTELSMSFISWYFCYLVAILLYILFHVHRLMNNMQCLCLPSTKEKTFGKSTTFLLNSLDSEKENNLTKSVLESGGKENGYTHHSKISDNTKTRKPTMYSSVLDKKSVSKLNKTGQEPMCEKKQHWKHYS